MVQSRYNKTIRNAENRRIILFKTPTEDKEVYSLTIAVGNKTANNKIRRTTNRCKSYRLYGKDITMIWTEDYVFPQVN